MSLKTYNPNITKRERDVLEVLWDNDDPLLASDIPKINPSLGISTVQLALRNLLSKKIIEVADIVHSGTVLSRRYRPLISKADFISKEFIRKFKDLDQVITTQNIVATLLDHDHNEMDTILELESLLEERKNQLNRTEATGE